MEDTEKGEGKRKETIEIGGAVTSIAHVIADASSNRHVLRQMHSSFQCPLNNNNSRSNKKTEWTRR